MIEAERRGGSWRPRNQHPEAGRGVWLCQTKEGQDLVEIVLPQAELRTLLDECQRDFPEYALEVYRRLSVEADAASVPLVINKNTLDGIFRIQILHLALIRQGGTDADLVGRRLKRAFRLAARGRLKLIAALPG